MNFASRKPFGLPKTAKLGALSSSDMAQRAAAAVPGAAANCLVLWQQGKPRPELPAGAVFANLMLAAAASDGPPQLYETEGYAVFDPTASPGHTAQTAGIGSGRVVPVRQRHGLLSLVPDAGCRAGRMPPARRSSVRIRCPWTRTEFKTRPATRQYIFAGRTM